ncbi:hypothetical protein TCAL_05445, partial [Tigriopus californicus]
TNRWVIYNETKGTNYDGSQIPAEWFGWMHYKTDFPPTEEKQVNFTHILISPPPPPINAAVAEVVVGRRKLVLKKKNMTQQHPFSSCFSSDLSLQKKPVEYKWMATHKENLSGTKDAYMPYSTTRPKIESWKPGQKQSQQ